MFFTHSTCESHLNDNLRTNKSCGRHNSTFLDHKMCRDLEMQTKSVKEEYSTWRCFPYEDGFFCANAYYMPCVPNYDQNGKLAKAKACPNHFRYMIVGFAKKKNHIIFLHPGRISHSCF